MSTLETLTFRLYDTDAFTYICELPSPVNINLSIVGSDTGSLSFEYAKQAVNGSNTLAEHRYIAVEIDGVEYDNCRFIIEEIQGSRTEAANYVITCRSLLSLFEKAIVYPPNWNMQGQPGQPSPFVLQQVEAFGNSTQGRIMRYLANKAQGRGTLTQWGFSTFTNTTDSRGVAWNQLLNITYDVGTNYYEILRSWVDGLLVDLSVGPDLAFHLYNWNTLGVDYTVGPSPVVLYRGRDISDSPYHSTGRDRASFILVHGEEAVYAEAGSSSAYNEVGRWEQFIDSGGITDSGTLSMMAQLQLTSSSKIKQEHNFNINPMSGGPQPMKDFKPGDWIFGDYGSGNVRLQVRQITIATDDKGTVQQSVVTLNDLINTFDMTLEARMNSLSHGKGTATTRVPSSKDKMPPHAPLGVALSSDAYVDSAKHTHAQLTIAWTPPTTDADGSVLNDLDHFNVSWQYDTGPWTALPIPGGDEVSTSVSPLDTNRVVRARVRAVDSSGNKSEWANSGDIVTGNDTVPPPVPTAPTVDPATLPGILRIRWDGKGVGNVTMPADFDYIEVHISTTTGFTPSSATLYDSMRTAGIVDIAGKANTALFIKFISVDRNVNKSAASAQATGTPVPAVGTDIDTGALTINTVQFKDINNLIPDGSFEDATNRAAITPALPAGWSLDNTQYSHGAWSLKTTGPGTWTIVSGMTVTPGQQYWLRFAEKGVAAAGVVAFGMTVTLQDGSTTPLQQIVGTSDLGWGIHANVVTMPVNAAFASFFLQTTHTSGTRWIDALEVRLMISTAIIQDAAITTAQIQDLAVNDAKITNLNVGKLISGIVYADMLLSGVIRTAYSGARVEITSAGIYGYDASSVNTFTLNALTGDISLTARLSTKATGFGLIVLDGATSVSFPAVHGTQSNWPSIKMNTPSIITSGCISVTPGLYNGSNPAMELISPRNGSQASGLVIWGSGSSYADTGIDLFANHFNLFATPGNSLFVNVQGSITCTGTFAAQSSFAAYGPSTLSSTLTVAGYSQFNPYSDGVNAGVRILEQNTSMTDRVMHLGCEAGASSGWDFLRMTSSYSSAGDRKFTFTGAGAGRCDASWTGGGADYAELFETVTGKTLAPGTLVALEGKKVRRARQNDALFAVVSTNPSVIGNEPLTWPGMYVKNLDGTKKQNDDGSFIVAKEYDADQNYVLRSDRPEWVPVALLGQVPAVDDGTCIVGGFASVGTRGRLTAAEEGWRVLERIDDDRVLVLVR